MPNKTYKQELFRIMLAILLIFCSFLMINGQNPKLDSLMNKLNKARHDSIRCRLMQSIGKQYENISPDSAIVWYKKTYTTALKYENKSEIFVFYAASSLQSLGVAECRYNSNYDLSMQYSNQALKLYEILIKTTNNREIYKKSKKGCAVVYSTLGMGTKEKGNYDIAIDYYSKALKINEEIGNKLSMAGNYANIGLVYSDQGIYDKAIEYHIKALKINEELGNKKGIVIGYGNIGVVHYNQGNLDKALEYYFKDLTLAEELGDKEGMGCSLNNIGLIYSDQGKPDKAIEYYLKSLKLFEELNDHFKMASCYNNIGIIFLNKGNFDKAYEYFFKSLKIDEEIGSKIGIATDYGNISNLYLAMADSSKGPLKSNYLKDAILYGKKSYNLALEAGILQMQNDATSHLKRAYTMLGKYAEALKYAELFIATNDSMFKEEKTKSIADAEAKFKTEKKQFEIDKLNKEKELQQSELLRQQEKSKRQVLLIVFVIAGLFLIALFAVFVVQRLRITRKQKQIIEKQKEIVDEKNIILNQQNEEISTQRDEIEAQRDLVVKQNNIIELKNKNITDSIRYALRIQQAILPLDEKLDGLLQDYFVFYQPKDIVSGDFYWTESYINSDKETITLFAAVDCTGHGVPGAFMSLLGYNGLTQAVKENSLKKPSEILNFLSNYIRTMLRQRKEESNVKDGMDLFLCSLNKNTMILEYAGVHNTAYIVRNGECLTLTTDNHPIAEPFSGEFGSYSNNEFDLQKGDSLYLYTDGYIDQFGGKVRKKFMSKRFRELLAEIYLLSMVEQKQKLKEIFEEWKGNNEQYDDVLVLGLKV